MTRLIYMFFATILLSLTIGCGKTTTPNEEDVDTIEVDGADLFCDADTCAADTLIEEY